MTGPELTEEAPIFTENTGKDISEYLAWYHPWPGTHIAHITDDGTWNDKNCNMEVPYGKICQYGGRFVGTPPFRNPLGLAV